MDAHSKPAPNRSVDFFDRQFQRQSGEGALALNGFEAIALPYLRGEVLDFGCGLGNLSFAAAKRGCTVTALDASPAAVAHIRSRAALGHASVFASEAELRHYRLTQHFDCIVAIGLLMFFDCGTAQRVLGDLKAHVRAGGVVVLNVLIEGTTFMDMFDVSGHCLYTAEAVAAQFDGWKIEQMEGSDFDAPGGTVKRFCTVVARKP
ncbi:MAG: class I SAM-dependent methyltransferase [Pseudomonadota bacterium]